MMHLSPGGAARLEEIRHSFPLNWLKWYSEIADASKYVVGGHTANPDYVHTFKDCSEAVIQYHFYIL
jgi:hypothetical protein